MGTEKMICPCSGAAGLGVAMENGEEQVKQAADFVTVSNNDAGVASAIRKFVLE